MTLLDTGSHNKYQLWLAAIRSYVSLHYRTVSVWKLVPVARSSILGMYT